MTKINSLDIDKFRASLESLTTHINYLNDNNNEYVLNTLGDIMFWSQKITEHANGIVTEIESGSYYEASTCKSMKKSLNWDDNSPDRMTASCGDLTFVITSINDGDYYVAEVYGIDGMFPEESFSTLGEAKDWCEGQCGKSVNKSFNSMIESQRTKNRRD